MHPSLSINIYSVCFIKRTVVNIHGWKNEWLQKCIP
jgi:hypothetical protein